MPEIRDDAGRIEPGEGAVPGGPGPDAEPHTPEAPGVQPADTASAPVFASDVAAQPLANEPVAPALAPPPAPAAPVDTGWLRVSPKYIVVEVVGSLIGMVVFVGGQLVAYALGGMLWTLWGAIVIGVISLIGIAFEPRRVRSIGYRLREDDLVFKRGIMFQRQVAVPYGRMQLVDITRGPVARALGLADLKFVTAAAATAVTVPGLPMEEADRLRDELVALAETRRAGL